MEQEVQAIMEEAAEYVAQTQPVLDKQAEASEKFSEHLTKTAETLVGRGLLREDKLDEWVEKSAEDHTFVLQYLSRLAESVPADQLGGATHTTKNAESADAFELAFAPEIFEETGD